MSGGMSASRASAKVNRNSAFRKPTGKNNLDKYKVLLAPDVANDSDNDSDDDLEEVKEVIMFEFPDNIFCGTLSHQTGDESDLESLGEKTGVSEELVKQAKSTAKENNCWINPGQYNFWSAYLCSKMQVPSVDLQVETDSSNTTINYVQETVTRLYNFIEINALRDWMWEAMPNPTEQSTIRPYTIGIPNKFVRPLVQKWEEEDKETNHYSFALQRVLQEVLQTPATDDLCQLHFKLYNLYNKTFSGDLKTKIQKVLIEAAFMMITPPDPPTSTSVKVNIQDWAIKALATMDRVTIKMYGLNCENTGWIEHTIQPDTNITYIRKGLDGEEEENQQNAVVHPSTVDYLRPVGLTNRLVLGKDNEQWRTMKWKDFLWLAVLTAQEPGEKMSVWIDRLLKKAKDFSTGTGYWKTGLAVMQPPTSNTLLCLLQTMLKYSRKKNKKFNFDLITERTDDKRTDDLYFDYVIGCAKRMWYAVAVKFCQCLNFGNDETRRNSLWEVKWDAPHVADRPRLDQLIVKFVPNDHSKLPSIIVTDANWVQSVKALYSKNISYYVAEFQKEMLKKMPWESDDKHGLFCFWFNELDVFRCLDYLEKQQNPEEGDYDTEYGLPRDFEDSVHRVTTTLSPKAAGQPESTEELEDTEEPNGDSDEHSQTGSTEHSQGSTAERKSDHLSHVSDTTHTAIHIKAPLPDILHAGHKAYEASYKRFCDSMRSEVRKKNGKALYYWRDRDVRQEYMRRGACTWWRLIHAYSSQDKETTLEQLNDTDGKLEAARVRVGYLEGDQDLSTGKIRFTGIGGVKRAVANWRAWRNEVKNDGKRWKYMAYGSGMSAPGVASRGLGENEYLVRLRGGL